MSRCPSAAVSGTKVGWSGCHALLSSLFRAEMKRCWPDSLDLMRCRVPARCAEFCLNGPLPVRWVRLPVGVDTHHKGSGRRGGGVDAVRVHLVDYTTALVSTPHELVRIGQRCGVGDGDANAGALSDRVRAVIALRCALSGPASSVVAEGSCAFTVNT